MLTTPEECWACSCSSSSSLCARHTRAHIHPDLLLLCVLPLPRNPQMCKMFHSEKKSVQQGIRSDARAHTQHLICGTGAAYVILWLSFFSFLRITTQTYFWLVLASLIRRMPCMRLRSHKNKPRVFLSMSKRKKPYLQAAAPTRPPSSRHWWTHSVCWPVPALLLTDSLTKLSLSFIELTTHLAEHLHTYTPTHQNIAWIERGCGVTE